MGILSDLVATTLLLVSAGMSVWMAGAIYYDVANGSRWAPWLAAGWLAAVVALFAFWQPLWQPFVVLFGIAVVFLAWWLRQRPSHHRDWDPSVAVLPRAHQDGDAIAIANVRHFEYRSLDDFTPSYESRTVHLANLQGADLIFFNWGSRWMSHPVFVFDFGHDGRICISIEVRYRKDQDYSILRSFYRQQELIFLVAAERDVILRRTQFGQEALLYRFYASPEELRLAFLDYVSSINSIYDSPRWYHGVCANCTTSFYRLPGSRVRCDWRVIANGRLDKALYEAGRLDSTVPFSELQRFARLTAIANNAPAEGFGDHIRRELERRRHER